MAFIDAHAKNCWAAEFNCMRTIRRYALSSVLLLAFAVSGCGHREVDGSGIGVAEQDPNESIRSFLAGWRSPDPTAKHRTQVALAKWENGVVDPEPILLTATLSEPRKTPPVIILVAFDEDKDLLGFGIIEKHADGTERVEEYPVFIHLQQLRVIDTRAIAVEIRDKAQQKDGPRWDEYVRGETIDKWSLKHVHNYYTDTMPPVYVSVPESNRVQVSVYLYDRRGNKCTPVDLVNHLKREGVRREGIMGTGTVFEEDTQATQSLGASRVRVTGRVSPIREITGTVTYY